MFEIVIPSFYLLAGVMTYATVHHFASALKPPRNRVQMVFAGMCLLTVVFILLDVMVLRATNITDFVLALKWNIAGMLLFFILFSWFIPLHTGRFSRPWMATLNVVFAVLFVLNLMQPYSLQYETLNGLSTLHLPWGEEVTRGDGHNGIPAYFTVAMILVAFVYALYALADAYHRYRRITDLCMLIAVGIFLLSAIEGILTRLSFFFFIEIGSFGIVAMVICMSATLTYEARQQLYTSERRFRLLFENSPLCVHEIDLNGRFLSMNQAGLDMLGKEDEGKICGVPFLNAVSQQDGRRIQSIFQEAISKGTTCNFEFTTAGDVPLYFKSCFIPIKGANGQVVKVMGLTEDITERKKLEEQMHDLAFYDALTKLPNRRLLLDRLDMELASCMRTRRHGALLFLDLDNFKTLNDLHGHEVGDLLLIEVANRLLGCTRQQDSIARMGGDEFVILLTDLSEQLDEAVIQAEGFAEKIRMALAQPYQLKWQSASGVEQAITHHSSSSIGVTLFGERVETLDQLLKWADMAMYRAKEAGRNAIRFFDPAMQSAIKARATLEADMHLALETGQFRLLYQVQVDSKWKPQGAEVLLRWQHPQRGLVAPEQFILLAEATGLILPIGAWVLDTVCAQIKSWENQKSFCNLVLAVNISAKQLRQADFVEQVQAVVQKHGIKPVLLKLELTESLALENVEDTIAKMKALKEFGVSFSIDDFGTGYSSLSYLKRLPLNQVKIDQSFVQNITADTADKEMVMTISDLGMNFELDVIAEGVETEAQFNLLRRCGCGSFQGYLFSKPVPIAQFEEWITQRLR